MAKVSHQKPHVVIVGSGFGGLSAAKELAKAPVDITVIDKHNYHLFQPLLYQVATAALSPGDVAWPIRHILRTQKNARVILGTVTGVDSSNKSISLKDGTDIAYDYLILATGVRHSYFGKDDWETNAPGLKTISDATTLRQKILLAFEKAEVTDDPKERERLLTFVVIGAGPTGVEMAGAIAELARHSIVDDFTRISPECSRIIIIEGGERVLPSFDKSLSANAKKTLEKMDVEVITNTFVDHLDEDCVKAGDLKIESHNVIWAAGVQASPAGEWLSAETDRCGRVIVTDHLNVKGHDDIFAIGDTVSFTPKGEKMSLPGVAPVAKQMGKFVSKIIKKKIKGKARPKKAFHYRNYGYMATIGRNNAIADFGFVKFKGVIGWWLWGCAHIYFLVGAKNRVMVAISWFWQYVTKQRGTCLITKDDDV